MHYYTYLVVCLLHIVWICETNELNSSCTGIYANFPNEEIFNPVQLLKEFVVISSVIPLTKYRLYTRRNADTFHILRPGEILTIRSSFYRATLDTKIIIHGYLQNADDDWVQGLKTALLNYDDYNVIVVDWGEAARVHFPYAVLNVHRISAEATWMTKYLRETTAGDLKRFHLIGSDLGAQVSSFVGKQVNKLGRITGLDPTGSGFKTYPPEFRLSSSDAIFVDVIHTNAEEHFRGYGMPLPVGHFDFYPNGGISQPGCLDNVADALREGNHAEVPRLSRCSHQWAEDLFTDSLLNPICQYVGYACSSWDDFLSGECASCGPDGTDCAIMGIHSDTCCTIPHDILGKKYYFVTNRQWPYCLYHYQVMIKIGVFPGSENQYGKLYLRLEGDRNEVSTQLSRKVELFVPGETYSYLITNQHSLGPIKGVQMFWIRSTYRVFDTKTPKISIDFIQVTPMSVIKRELDDGKVSILYGNTREVITPGAVLNITRRG